ncbi:FadR/GntR family transcriptional regulator [Thorsellia kenyensis]|uniref:FadR/GntR family transcriptional regulator n=1 Tax=Thorsellia kenyensis TaxID=1549888 RepID=A0ABV6CB22_9GAMM
MSIKRMSVVQQAVELIESKIINKEWLRSEQLPSQNDLSKILNISRASLREALSIIESKGLINIQPGKGVFVIENTLQQREKWPYAEYSLKDVFALRHELEGYAAQMAALHATKNDIKKLQTSIEQSKVAALDGDLLTVQICDVDFHSQIINLAQNNLLLDVIKKIRKPVDRSQSPPKGDYVMLAPTLKEHENIFQAISMAKPELARAAMQKHIINAALRANVKL